LIQRLIFDEEDASGELVGESGSGGAGGAGEGSGGGLGDVGIVLGCGGAIARGSDFEFAGVGGFWDGAGGGEGNVVG
jgi:hypothetical protein